LANRSIVTSHRKQPQGYQHKSSLGWGDVEPFKNIRSRQGELLGAIHATLADWIRLGKPHTDEQRHDFRDWVQATDYIVQKILRLPPLMDDHQESQKILSDQIFAWFRQVAIKITETTPALPVELQAGDIGELCEEYQIEIPNLPKVKTFSLADRINQRNIHIGKLLGNHIYKEVTPDPSTGELSV
jgi:hypothetical protein